MSEETEREARAIIESTFAEHTTRSEHAVRLIAAALAQAERERDEAKELAKQRQKLVSELEAVAEQARYERDRTAKYAMGLDETIDVLVRERDAARAEVERLKNAYSRMNAEIEQTLAQTIGGYPWYKDDQKNFPGATEKDGVCVGEHVAESLAMEAARLITTQKADLARVRAALDKYGRHLVDCRWRINGVDACSCGYRAALEGGHGSLSEGDSLSKGPR